MNSTAFIVKDHKTYMTAEEAWYQFHQQKEGSYLFVIIPAGDPNNVEKTLKDSIDKEKWQKVEWIKTLSNYNTRKIKLYKQKYWIFGKSMKLLEYFFNFIDVRRLNLKAKKYAPVKRVFSGHRNTQEHLAAKLKPSELILMDSGTTFKKIRNSGFIDYTLSSTYRSSLFAKVMFRLIGFKKINREKTRLFTVYYDSIKTKHFLIKNNQSYKKHLIQEKTVGEDVVFISSPVYQITEGVEIENFLNFLKEIMKYFKIESKNFIYIPNPVREKKENVDYIINKLSCKYDDRSIPVEIKITDYDELPKFCMSFYSTALVNLFPMVKDKIKLYSIWHPDFDYFKHIVDWKKEIINNKEIEIEFITLDNSPVLFNFDPKLLEKHQEFLNYNDWRKKQSEIENSFL